MIFNLTSLNSLFLCRSMSLLSFLFLKSIVEVVSKTLTLIFQFKGFLYHSKDSKYHQGRVVQEASLRAFNRALELDGNNLELVMQVSQNKGKYF